MLIKIKYERNHYSSQKWEPWGYEKILSDAKAIQSEKKQYVKNNKVRIEDIPREKVTQWVAKRKSRQESIPLVGQYIDRAKADPLHIKNNCVQFMFCQLLSCL